MTAERSAVFGQNMRIFDGTRRNFGKNIWPRNKLRSKLEQILKCRRVRFEDYVSCDNELVAIDSCWNHKLSESQCREWQLWTGNMK